jgi:hypothetical protein
VIHALEKERHSVLPKSYSVFCDDIEGAVLDVEIPDIASTLTLLTKEERSASAILVHEEKRSHDS